MRKRLFNFEINHKTDHTMLNSLIVVFLLIIMISVISCGEDEETQASNDGACVQEVPGQCPSCSKMSLDYCQQAANNITYHKYIFFQGKSCSDIGLQEGYGETCNNYCSDGGAVLNDGPSSGYSNCSGTSGDGTTDDGTTDGTTGGAGDGDDTMSNASSLSYGAPQSGSISTANDVDYYKVTYSCGEVDIILFNRSSSSIKVGAYSSSGTAIGYSWDNSLGNAYYNLNSTHYPSGTYYFKVYSTDGSTGDYAIKMLDLVCTDDNNDSFSTSTSISFNSTINGMIKWADYDYYKLMISMPMTIKVDVTNIDDNLALRLYDSAENLVASASSTVSSSKNITFTVNTTGTYYIAVFGGLSEYSLVVTSQ